MPNIDIGGMNMPHSSGGGSHGGGSHGGSHGSHGSHGGRSGPRISRTHFAGARRYSYYRHGQQRYFYADKNFKPGFSWGRLLLIFFYLPFYFLGFSMLKPALKILPKNYDHTIIIKDEANVINDEAALKKELERFRDKTGVTPSVVTVHNETWANYGRLEEYAYDRYLREFDDEMHWLIVYSEPIDPDPKFNNWFWEGMQGNDTDPVITEERADKLTARLHGAIVKGDDVETALKTSFSQFTDNYSRSFNFGELIPALFVLGFVSFHAYFMLGLNELKYRKAVPADGSDIGGRSVYDPTAQFQSYKEYKQSAAYNGAQTQPVTQISPQYTPQSGMDDLFGSGGSSTAENSRNTVCQYCGTTFAAKYKRCPSCNAENPDRLN